MAVQKQNQLLKLKMKNTENQNSESAIDFNRYGKTDLSEFDFPIEIYIPSNNGKPEITATKSE